MKNSPIASRLTAIDHECGTCDRTCAKLLIYPAQLDHEAITAILAVKPTYAQNKGDEIPTRRGTIRMARTTYWCLSSDLFVASKDVRPHIEWLLDALSNSTQGLQTLQDHHEVVMGVECEWWSYGLGGPALWPEQLRRLADLNLECGFSLQFHSEDDIFLPTTSK